MKTEGWDPLDCTFVNFEDPRLSNDLDFKLLDKIVAFSRARRPKGIPLKFFFDEIQNVLGWEKWLRLRTERPAGDCYAVTGSNAALLSGDLASVLTGRHITLELFPFDYAEYRLAQTDSGLDRYLDDGGFPRVLSYAEPQALLREYFTDIVERDVRRHVAARSSRTLMSLIKAVFESTGSELSQRRLSSMLGISVDMAGAYLNAAESAYLILSCPYFTFSERQRTARHRKYYPIDLGLRGAVVSKTGLDAGKKLEMAVFLFLRRKYRDLSYWRGKGEVDFVIRDGGAITPWQVSWDGMKPRHERAVKEFQAEFPQANPVVVVTRENAEEVLRG